MLMQIKSGLLPILVTGIFLLPCCMQYHRHNEKSNESEYYDEDESSDNNSGSDENTSKSSSKYRYETRVLKLEKAEKAKMNLSMPAGYFMVKGGSSDLLEGKFKYRKSERSLVVSNLVDSKGQAEVVVDMKKLFHHDIHNEKNTASISVNNSIPLDLELSFGAGEGKFDFRNTNLQKAKFDLGAGDFNIDLSQTSLSWLKVNAGVGKGYIDLSGDWKQDLKAEFSCGVGELILVLPSSSGVRVEVNGALGEVEHHGFDKDGQTYTNDAFKKSSRKLDITVNGGIGKVELRTKE
jgi:hypothetical protein